MSDLVAVALITGISGVVQVGLRIMSHYEHRSTSRDVSEIKQRVNGDLDQRIEDAVKRAMGTGSN